MCKRLLQLKFIILFLVTVFTTGKVYASHLAAADIYVNYIGTGPNDLTYKVTLIVYRACELNNATLSGTDYVTVSSASCGVSNIQVLVDTTGNNTDDTLDQLCPGFSQINSCRDPTSQWPGFERYMYTGVVTLPTRCSDWVFDWNLSARNAAILNLCQPDGQALEVKCLLNNLFRFNMNSPQFVVNPIPYFCINQPQTLYNGPIDPDGDSVYVTNVQPIGCLSCSCGPGGTIPYAAGYSLVNPVAASASNPYYVDPYSGVASFTPTTQGKFVLAYHCNKYDRQTGTLLSYITRDVQISVLPCNSPSPAIDSVPINISGGLYEHTSGNLIVGCPGSPITFSIQAHSQSSSNNIKLSADNGTTAPGSSFSYTYPPGQPGDPVGTFTWTPSQTDIGTHAILITATDSTCNNSQPLLFHSYMVVNVSIINGIATSPSFLKTCALNPPVKLNVTGLPGLQYHWTDQNGSVQNITNPNSATPLVHPQWTTDYIVMADGLPPGCKSKDTVVVNVDTLNHAKITPASPIYVCQPGILNLHLDGYGPHPLTNLSCGLATSTYPGVADSTELVPQNSSLQNSSNPYVSPFGGNYTERHQYLLRASDLRASGTHSGTIKAIAFYVSQVSANAVYNNFTISMACTNAPLSPTGALSNNTVQVYSAPAPISFTNPGLVKFNFDNGYNWDTTQDILLDVCYSSTTSTPGPVFVNYYNTDYPSCIFSYYTSGSVCTNGTSYSGGAPLYQIPQIKFYYNDAPDAPYDYYWGRSYGNDLIADTTVQNAQMWIQTNSKYYGYIIGKSGCPVRDSATVILVPPRNSYVQPIDTSICAGRSTWLKAFNGSSYEWFNDTAGTLSCLNCAVTTSTPAHSTAYSVSIADNVGCKDTFRVHVNVLPLPVFHILNSDTTIHYGQSIQLSTSTPEYSYIWEPAQTLDNAYVANPIATPLEPTTYTVIGLDGNCSTTDSVHIDINYRDNIFVPSAFTPNRDGKNDVFRVANLTYQKLIEFRVFNRWGREVYNAIDNNGWDGTWNGVAQDMGTYYYIVRVVYPDGYEQTFRGGVTLIR